MSFIFGAVLNWFVKGGFSALTDIYTKYKDSENQSERMQALWAKQQLDVMAENRRNTSSFWEMRLITFLVAGAFTLHLWLVALDTMFGWTFNGQPVPAFPKPMNEWEGAILLSFFGIQAWSLGLKTLSGIFRR